MEMIQSLNFLSQFPFAVASVEWESIRTFLWIAFPTKQMWDLTVYPYLQFVSRFLILFLWGFTRNLLLERKESLLTLTPMGDLGWKRLLSICMSFSHCCFKETWIWILLKKSCLLQGGYQKILSHLDLFLLGSDKGGLGSGYCETLGWSLTPFLVAKRHFSSLFGQKFNKMALTENSFYLVNLEEKSMGWNII